MSGHDYRTALSAAGLELLKHPTVGKYQGFSVVGNTLHVSGHIGWRNGGVSIVGTLGHDLDVPAGKEAARDAALAALGTVEKALGSLERVRSVPRLFGMVRASGTFEQHPAVIDGASEILLTVLGEDAGAHSRSAVGMSSLPFGAAVELEMMVVFDD
ncbi:RidA family protein [Kribbella sp. NPDC051587]|uniref:RidA family protein n=1 Tax=Kribbella sp. NPDC051587 TaxID=3364119 RepID=UPI0037A22166